MEAFKIWWILAVLCTFWERIAPCGISTHIEIAHRALEFFSRQDGKVDYRKLLLTHQDAYQAGSVYPDAFYSDLCKAGLFHYVSEDTHWAPFLNTSIHYIRKNYPQPWEEATEKLVAFLFGIASHMVADVSWHSLGVEQGFLQAMAAIDFHGSYPQAHSAGDFGGDVLSQFELDFDYVEPRWYVPVKDLLSIYKEFYGKEVITEDTVVDCTYIQLLELFGEIIAIARLYPIYAEKSPFLVDRFYDYFLGGVDNMAFLSNNIFQLTSWMIKNGSSGCLILDNPLYIQCKGEKRKLAMFKEPNSQQLRKITSSLTQSFEQNISYTERGVYLEVPPWAMNKNDTVKSLMEVVTVTQQSPLNHMTKPSASYFLKIPYARLGSAMTSADLNQDGYDDLVVGAPGYSQLGHIQLGRVYIVYGNKSGLPHSNLDLDQEADETLQGTKPSGRFGSALATLDFNKDGLLDLAVGAPTVGSQKLNYKGSVYIFLGNRGGGFHSVPNITIVCQEIYCHLGWSLLAADIDRDGNSDLVLGSPYASSGGKQRGLVAAFYSFPNRTGQDLLLLSDADWIVRGEMDFAWFGSSISSVQLPNVTLVLIGSPFGKKCTGPGCYFSQQAKKTVGKIYGYIPPSTQSWFTLNGDKEKGKFGSSLATGFLSVKGILKHVLVVGAPTQDSNSSISSTPSVLPQAGTALMYDLMGKDGPSLLSTFSGDRRFSRFGEVVQLRDLNNDGLDEIIVTSPLRSKGAMVELFGEQAGYVYIYSGNQTTSGHVTDHCTSYVFPCPEKLAEYVIISPEEKSRFGSAVLTVKTGQKNEVVIAAERSSVKARFSGRLFIYTF